MPFISSIRGNYSAVGRGSRTSRNLKLDITGGTITTAGGYRIHTFLSPGTFNVSALGASLDTEYLVVAGAGGGGARHGGGGGAGGFLQGSLSVPATSYPITVGGGGTGALSDPPGGGQGTNGQNSTYSSVTATGGGGGGDVAASDPDSQPSGSGGSGIVLIAYPS